jgi:hypothetical protein
MEDTKQTRIGVMVFNATFKNISIIWWRSVLLVEETGVLGENRPAAVCYFCSIEEKHCKHISNVYYHSKNCMFFNQAQDNHIRM